MRRALLLMIVPLLAGCAAGGGNPFVPPAPSDTTGFTATLSQEYANLAAYEQTLNDPRMADYFRHKAAQPESRPDNPIDAPLAGEARVEMSEAWQELIDALHAPRTAENGPLQALAQTRFDCWLALRANYGTPSAGIGCRDQFHQALALISPQAAGPHEGVYSAFFDSGSIAIRDASQGSIHQAALSVGQDNNWAIVLRGYTDTHEDDGEKNRKLLSMRRAMSVRNALAQQGVPMSLIRVDAFGAAPEGREGNPDQERRVDIVVMTAAQAATVKSSNIEDVVPEYFGSKKPVF